MHEISLSTSIIDIITHQAHMKGFQRVRRVWLEIGDLANVEREALRFAFEFARTGTTAAEAELEIITVPARAHCLDCVQVVAIQQRYDPCPLCGSHRWQLLSGAEMRIKELEVE